MKIQTKKVFYSVILGPLYLLPAICILGVISFIFEPHGFESILDVLTTSLAYSAFGLFVTYPLTILFGLPLAILLKSYNKFKLPIILVCSVIPVIIMFGVVEPHILGLLSSSFVSLAVALGCWRVYWRTT